MVWVVSVLVKPELVVVSRQNKVVQRDVVARLYNDNDLIIVVRLRWLVTDIHVDLVYVNAVSKTMEVLVVWSNYSRYIMVEVWV